MKRTDFDDLREAFFDRIRATNDAKGHDYAGDEDALANFKEAAEHLADIHDPTFEAWYIYFHKHWSAILTFLKEGDVKSEPIDGRIMDAVLYLILLLGLIEDKKAEAAASTRAAELADRATRHAEHAGGSVHVVDPPPLGGYRPVVPSPWDILQSYIGKKWDDQELLAIQHEMAMHGHPGQVSYQADGRLLYVEGYSHMLVTNR